MRTNLASKNQVLLILFSIFFSYFNLITIASFNLKSIMLLYTTFYIPILLVSFQIICNKEVLPKVLLNTMTVGVTVLGLNYLINNILLFNFQLGTGSELNAVYDNISKIIVLYGLILVIVLVSNKLYNLLFRILNATIVVYVIIILLISIFNVFNNSQFTIWVLETQHINLLKVVIPFIYLNVFSLECTEKDRNQVKNFSIFLIFIVLLIKVLPVVNIESEFIHLAVNKTLFENYSYFVSVCIEILIVLTNLSLFMILYKAIIMYGRTHYAFSNKYNILLTTGTLSFTWLIIFHIAGDASMLMKIFDGLFILIHLVIIVLIMLFGMYMCIKMYIKPRLKAILLVMSTFPIIYIVIYLSNYSNQFINIIENLLREINVVFLIISLVILLAYTLESVVLFIAYSRRLKSDELTVSETRSYKHIFVMIPCLNEGLVINETLQSVLANDYSNLHVYVIDDASSDNTKAEIMKVEDSRCTLVERSLPTAQIGKGEALNWTYKKIVDAVNQNLIDHQEVLIAVIDADTKVESDYFYKVNKVFESNSAITGLQSKVRVINLGKDNAQDLEFSEIINSYQSLRNMTDTVAFGGNGQFCKLSTLEMLDEKPWNDSLVEDFDLSTRLYLSATKPIKNIQYDDIYVMQSGIVDDVPALVKQRVRWAQGNVQSFKYFKQIISSKRLRKIQKLELIITLIKPWMMAIEYLILLYTLVLIVDILIIDGFNSQVVLVIAALIITILYIYFINLIWAILYNKQNDENIKVMSVIHDSLHLTKFLFTLTQIYPQSLIRHLNKENNWEKTKRQIE